MSALAETSPAPALERYRAAFDARAHGSDAMSVLRRAALQDFLAAGFPTQRQEEWKYTNLRRLEGRAFAPAGDSPSLTAVESGQFVATAGPRYVFVNGTLSPGLSTSLPQPPGMTVLTFGQWLARAPDEVADFLTQHSSGSQAFADLNTAFMEDGLVVEISENAKVEEPVCFVHLWSDGARATMSHPRVVVRARRNSRCTLLEHYLGSGDGERFTNAVTGVHLEEGAALTHYRLQQEAGRDFHIGTTHVRAERGSRYSALSVGAGAGLARESTIAHLEGPEAAIELRGLFAPAGSQHLDVYTRVEHVAPHTRSMQEYRGIAGGRGRGVYNGKVIVHPGAQKIEARQSSRNLLLSATAEIDTRPELEIYANDVKCSHGATTGQLDVAALFYLRSRGLSEEAARAALIRAFAQAILSAVSSSGVRAHIETLLSHRFEGGGQP
jgi:Fe-S cluster assembly protein SufD